MRCANKAATEAAAWMRAAGEQVTQVSVSGVLSTATAKQPIAPTVAGERGHSHAASSYVALAADGSPMDVDPDIEVIYLGESDPPSDSESPMKVDRKAVAVATTSAKSSGSVKKTPP